MIVFRADGNSTLGLGHVMRCMTVAEAVRKAGDDACFVTCCPETFEIVFKKGFMAYSVGDSFTGLKPSKESLTAEIPELREILKKVGAKVLVCDSYSASEDYFTGVNDLVKTAYIDDFGDADFPVDFMINYNIFAKDTDYSGSYRLLTGPEYAPVRESFRETKGPDSDGVKEILISSGGTDKFNLSYLIADELSLRFPEITFNVVCGPFNSHKAELTDLGFERKNVCIHVNVSDMASLMSRCDMAVSAAGSTMYELCTMGIPTVTFSFVDNQRRIAEGFGEAGAALLAGDYDTLGADALLKQILTESEKLISDAELRIKVRECAHGTVDGLGAVRLAETLNEVNG
ncbi:MAG: UDP-2,4-diacetamido-2,4,6-trideoxy-beta-L-altropyranose hydrolase [Lachnospiraceae bacterium]|nr:UDP-2,4-diacetamido-2,4,6-trideoxy-beta-L-altropyranose hydrolase [Lachnospiraceae bacterium]